MKAFKLRKEFSWCEKKAIINNYLLIKVGFSPTKKIVSFASVKALYKIMKIAFCLILKAPFILKIFKFLSWHFGHVEKTA